MYLNLKSIHEDKPGPKWQGLFNTYWHVYRRWFLSEGHLARPGYMTSIKKLREFMPELTPIYEELVDLAGGGDLAARFLSMYRPPAYLAGCSQAVWLRGNPILIRNYDYSPKLFEGALLNTVWRRPVIAMSDCLWGVLDGINNAGLAVSLAFGGRRIVGDGFGIPLILRYVLEVCDDTAAAVKTLQRVPVHMPYNVTVVDHKSEFVTAYLSPDSPAFITKSPVCTNHQNRIEWPDYVRATASIERREFLDDRLSDPEETAGGLIRRFLQPPLLNTQYEKGRGTLYTAAYYPCAGQVEYYWQKQTTLRQSFSNFQEQTTVVSLAPSSFRTRTLS